MCLGVVKDSLDGGGRPANHELAQSRWRGDYSRATDPACSSFVAGVDAMICDPSCERGIAGRWAWLRISML